MTGDGLTFAPGPRWTGHGMPGVDLVWHRADEECPRCPAGPRLATMRASKVDHATGVVTFETVVLCSTPGSWRLRMMGKLRRALGWS